MKIAGLDIGTSSCKCTVFDSDGTYLDNAHKAYPVKRMATCHEIDMKDVRDSVFEVISEIAHKYPDIAGIGVTTFGETIVLTDEDGEPLHVSMLYTDPRGADECRELVEKLGEMHITEITGTRPHEMYGLPKLMWLRNNRPDVFERARHVFQPEDFIVFSLCGVAQIDYSLATRSLAFDVDALDWSDEILTVAGIGKALYPKPVPSGTVAGKVTREVAAKTGLSENCVIVSISQDQIAAAVGAGAFSGDIAVDGSGTVQCMTPVFERRPDVNTLYKGYFVTVPYVVSGKFVTYAFLYTGGALIQWCVDTLAKKEKEEADKLGISVYELLEKQYAEKMTSRGLPADEPTGLLVLPHFAGAATPYMDTGSKGTVVGLTTDTAVCDIYMACREGVCYEMYLLYKMLNETGYKPEKFHATGGGAHSAVWMQMKADMLGVPFTALKTVDAGTVGSAMLTGISTGVFKDLQDAASHMVEETVTYQPRAEMHEKYMQHFARYEGLYKAVRPLM